MAITHVSMKEENYQIIDRYINNIADLFIGLLEESPGIVERLIAELHKRERKMAEELETY